MLIYLLVESADGEHDGRNALECEREQGGSMMVEYNTMGGGEGRDGRTEERTYALGVCPCTLTPDTLPSLVELFDRGYDSRNTPEGGRGGETGGRMPLGLVRVIRYLIH